MYHLDPLTALQISAGATIDRPAAVVRELIDNAIDANSDYRVLVKPNFEKKKWPKELRVGIGARGYVMLNRVPMWYEIWRNINGFPSDFYKSTEKQDSKFRKKSSS